MDLANLKQEITDDPVGLGYSGDDVQDSKIINTVQRSGLRELSSRELLAWAGQNGRYAKIYDATTDLNNSQTVRSICFVASKLFDRSDATLDLRLDDRQQMLAALVSFSVLSQEDSDSLYSMASSNISRAEELGLNRVTPSDIANARRLI